MTGGMQWFLRPLACSNAALHGFIAFSIQDKYAIQREEFNQKGSTVFWLKIPSARTDERLLPKYQPFIYYDQEGQVRAVGAEATQEGILTAAADGQWFKAEYCMVGSFFFNSLISNFLQVQAYIFVPSLVKVAISVPKFARTNQLSQTSCLTWTMCFQLHSRYASQWTWSVGLLSVTFYLIQMVGKTLSRVRCAELRY